MTKTILLVDDEPDILAALRDVLEYQHYYVVCACDGLNALELLKTAAPDVIVSDVRMPHVNGQQFFERLKSSSTKRHIPFIFMTATPETVISIGAQAVLRKPFLIEGLLREVSIALKIDRQDIV